MVCFSREKSCYWTCFVHCIENTRTSLNCFTWFANKPIITKNRQFLSLHLLLVLLGITVAWLTTHKFQHRLYGTGLDFTQLTLCEQWRLAKYTNIGTMNLFKLKMKHHWRVCQKPGNVGSAPECNRTASRNSANEKIANKSIWKRLFFWEDKSTERHLWCHDVSLNQRYNTH